MRLQVGLGSKGAQVGLGIWGSQLGIDSSGMVGNLDHRLIWVSMIIGMFHRDAQNRGCR